MSNFAPEETFKIKQYEGEWWIPGIDIKCMGHLTFDVDGESILSITGFIEGKQTIEPTLQFDVIHGNCRDNNNKIVQVTIFHGTTINWERDILSFEKISQKMVISVFDLWIGDKHYNSRDEVRFSSLSFGMNNLEFWIDARNVFSDKHDNTLSEIEIKMKLPEPIPLFGDKNVKISIDYWRTVSGTGLGHIEAYVKYRPYFYLEAQNGTLPYYGVKDSWEFYFSWVCQLFEILIVRYTFPFCVRGSMVVNERNHEEAEHLYAREISKKQRDIIQINKVMFPYRNVKENLKEIVNKFQENYSCMDNILGTLLSSFQKNSFCCHSLPQLLFSIEGLQQIFYHSFGESGSPQNKASYDDFDGKKKMVLAYCPNESIKAFVKEQIRWRATFRTRVKAMLLDMADIFTFLTDEMCESLSKKFTDVRNADAHSDTRDGKNDWTQQFPLYLFVQYWQIAIIMKFCGLPSAIIKECFFQDPVGINSFMSNLLKSCETYHKEQQDG